MSEGDALGFFDDTLYRVAPSIPPGLSADRRRTLRQRQNVEMGRHPLTGGLLHPNDARRCGNCAFRTHNYRGYPKCAYGEGQRATRGANTDVRAWWPGCIDHEWGDPKMSPDAARWVGDDDE